MLFPHEQQVNIGEQCETNRVDVRVKHLQQKRTVRLYIALRIDDLSRLTRKSHTADFATGAQLAMCLFLVFIVGQNSVLISDVGRRVLFHCRLKIQRDVDHDP